MKILFKLAAIATAFGLASGASAQAPATANAAAPVAAAPAPAAAAPAAAPAANETAAAPAAANAATPAAAPAAPERTAPTAGIGQPSPGHLGLQPQVSPIGEEASWFHDVILMPLITVISVFVLLLLLWVIIRYRRGANPVPSRNTHNTLLEVVWTLVPVLILVAIAVPSIRLLAHQYDPPQADVTVKVIGNQWYWDYEYPDNGVTLTSRILPDAEAHRRGEPRQLAVDNRMVVPVGAVVKLIVTSNDVIHAFGVPAFWTKIDAVPGRLNETWFRADREGVFYGVCYELCGAQHGYMPIAVEVVSQARFEQWVLSQGGHMAAPGGADGNATAAAPAPEGNATAAAPTPTGNVVAGTETPATTNQATPAN
ncbi:MAG TPA: cytochrome c oxidase subunit II [Allosphingosinicella sp.]|nr:cytochrome c oxidase subunit II [Allosphingosinicella sp.]